MQKEGHNKLVLMGVLSILILLVVGFALGALEQTGAAVFTNPSKQVIGASSTVSRAAAQAAIQPTLPKVGHYASDVILSDGTSVEKKLADLQGQMNAMDKEHIRLMTKLSEFVSANDGDTYVKDRFALELGAYSLTGWGHLFNDNNGNAKLGITLRTNFRVDDCFAEGLEFVTNEWGNKPVGQNLFDHYASEFVGDVKTGLYDPVTGRPAGNPGLQPNEKYYHLKGVYCNTPSGVKVVPKDPILAKWSYSG